MARQRLAARALICLILTIASSVSEALTPKRSNNKIVNAYCISEASGGINMVFTADFNGDGVDKVLAVAGDEYTGSNEASCQITELNTSGTKITISSRASLSGSVVTGSNTCGARQAPGNSNGFTWTIELRELFTQQVYTDIDRRYIILCKYQQGLYNVLSTSIKVYGEDTETGVTLVKPVNSMSVLIGDDDENYSLITPPQRVASGAKIRFQIDTQVALPYTAGLRHYGIYAFTARWSNSPTFASLQTADFISLNGCPIPGNRFGLTNGFKSPEFSGGLYKIFTDPFVLNEFNTVPGSSVVHVQSYVDYCYGALFSDAKCNDFCAYSTSVKRKRRNVANSTNLNDLDRVALTIIIDPATTDSGSDKVSSDVVIAVSASLAAILLAIIVVVVCIFVVAKRRRRTETDDKHSYSSEKYLHSTGVPPPKI